MSRADYSDPEIKSSLDELKKSPSTNWVLVGYVPKSDSKLKLVGKGSGGLAELADQLSDGKVLFALVAFTISNNKKFAYIAWCGEGVTGMKKGLFNNHANDIALCFKGFHIQINARHESDVTEKAIIEKLTKASGASYDSGEKIKDQQNLFQLLSLKEDNKQANLLSNLKLRIKLITTKRMKVNSSGINKKKKKKGKNNRRYNNLIRELQITINLKKENSSGLNKKKNRLLKLLNDRQMFNLAILQA